MNSDAEGGVTPGWVTSTGQKSNVLPVTTRRQPKSVSVSGLQNERIDAHAMAHVIIMFGRQLHAEANRLLLPNDRLEDQPKRRKP